MNLQYINPLLESTLTVLSTMAMLEVTPGEPSIKQNTKALGDITGFIELRSPQAQGSLAISFSKPAILEITESILGESTTDINDMIVDMVGELTNMITGAAKRIYADQGLDFELATPSTQLGKDTAIHHTVDGSTIILPFATKNGEFYVEVCFR